MIAARESVCFDIWNCVKKPTEDKLGELIPINIKQWQLECKAFCYVGILCPHRKYTGKKKGELTRKNQQAGTSINPVKEWNVHYYRIEGDSKLTGKFNTM